MTPRNRKRLYRALLAAAPLAVFYGLLTEQEAALWLAAAATWLGVGLAERNVPEDPA